MGSVVRSGVRLAFDDLGVGPPVLFHTGAGGDAGMWCTAGYLDALPHRRHVLFDHRGHGRSDRPQRADQHRLTEYLDDVVAVLDACEIDRTTFVGYSDGAYLGLALAAQHPERICALVAIGMVINPGEDLAERRRSAAELRRDGVRARIEAIASCESQAVPGWLIDNLCATSAEMFAAELEGWADAAPPAAYLARISAPALIVCGEREDSGRDTELVCAGLPGVTVVTMPDLGHLQVFWRSDLVTPIVADFLRQCDGLV